VEAQSGERLQKVIASAGIASRRGAEELIASGQVLVNGQVAALGMRVDPAKDVVVVRGVALEIASDRVYLAYNKPVGIVTSLASTHGERTVGEAVDVGRRVFPVGRLDKDTSGLLLLTDDGAWADAITHPRYEVEKEYLATVRGTPTHQALQRLREGIPLPDGSVTAPAVVGVREARGGSSTLAITVREGKKRQIRLMLAAVGLPVVALRRVRVGTIRLGDLSEGTWRHLSRDEVRSVHVEGMRD
jgi:23S rRNA pseudouridine2605 synthase